MGLARKPNANMKTKWISFGLRLSVSCSASLMGATCDVDVLLTAIGSTAIKCRTKGIYKYYPPRDLVLSDLAL